MWHAGINDRWSNVLSRGEGATLSWCYINVQAETPAHAGRTNCIFVNCKKLYFVDLWLFWGVNTPFISTNTDLVAIFRNCVGQYAKNSTIMLPERRCHGWMHSANYWYSAYCWLLYHFDQAEAHVIHRNLIVHSLFWLAFAKSFDDWSRPGRIPFNPKYWRDNMNAGCTAMKAIGDPMKKADKLFSTLASLFDDVRLQRLAVGTPCRENYRSRRMKL